MPTQTGGGGFGKPGVGEQVGKGENKLTKVAHDWYEHIHVYNIAL